MRSALFLTIIQHNYYYVELNFLRFLTFFRPILKHSLSAHFVLKVI